MTGRGRVRTQSRTDLEGCQLPPGVVRETRRPTGPVEEPREADEGPAVVATLRETQLFAGMPADRLQEIARAARPAVFVKGDIVAGIIESPHSLIIVAEGAARVCRVSVDGRHLILRELHAGDTFGLALLGQGADGGNMLWAASPELYVYCLSAATVEKALADDAALCLRALHLVSHGLSSQCEQSAALAFEPMRVRLAHTLAALAREQNGRVVVRHAQEELAARVGSRQEDVSRALRQLTRDGLIRPALPRPGVEIIDRAALASYA